MPNYRTIYSANYSCYLQLAATKTEKWTTDLLHASYEFPVVPVAAINASQFTSHLTVQFTSSNMSDIQVPDIKNQSPFSIQHMEILFSQSVNHSQWPPF